MYITMRNFIELERRLGTTPEVDFEKNKSCIQRSDKYKASSSSKPAKLNLSKQHLSRKKKKNKSKHQVQENQCDLQRQSALASLRYKRRDCKSRIPLASNCFRKQRPQRLLLTEQKTFRHIMKPKSTSDAQKLSWAYQILFVTCLASTGIQFECCTTKRLRSFEHNSTIQAQIM